MPIYQFKCEACGAVVEKLQAYEDEAPKCPASLGGGGVCLGDQTGGELKRLISPANSHFKGSGFYKTDYT